MTSDVNRSTFDMAVVIGGAGAVGRLFCQQLLDSGVKRVVSVDRRPRPASLVAGRAAREIEYLCADACVVNVSVHELTTSADLVIIALPSGPAESCVAVVAPTLSSDSLLVDTLSVKTPFLSALGRLSTNAEILSINPMFAPALGFAGQSVLLVEAKPGPLSNAFKRLIGEWCRHIVSLTAHEHDRYTAVSQALTHATLIVFGTALASMDYGAAQFRNCHPPPHFTMLALLARVLSNEPDVYRDIQVENPYAAEAREALISAASAFQTVVQSDDALQFGEVLDNLRTVLGGDEDRLASTCQAFFASIRDANE